MNNSPINYNDPTGHDVGCPASNPACLGISGHPDDPRYIDYLDTVKRERERLHEMEGEAGIPPFLSIADDYWPGLPPKLSADNPSTGPVISSWSAPSNWDLDPSHPDYNTTTLSLFFITVSHTSDRYDTEYWGFGGNIAKGFPISLTHNNGTIKTVDGMMPMQSDIESFLKGVSVNWSLGTGGDLSQTLSPFAGDRVSHVSNEYGALVGISIGLSVTFNIMFR